MHVTLPCEARANPNLVSGVARMESCHLRTSACPARDIPAIMVTAIDKMARLESPPLRLALAARRDEGLGSSFSLVEVQPPAQGRVHADFPLELACGHAFRRVGRNKRSALRHSCPRPSRRPPRVCPPNLAQRRDLIVPLIPWTSQLAIEYGCVESMRRTDEPAARRDWCTRRRG
jgi:hypothetical protein